MLQGKNEYKDGSIFYVLFSAPKIKYCLTINKYAVIDEHKNFQGFTNVSDNFDWKEYFKMFAGDKMIAKLLLSWKKSFNMCVVIPNKMGNCGDCKKTILCENCDKLVNERKNFQLIEINEENLKLIRTYACSVFNKLIIFVII